MVSVSPSSAPSHQHSTFGPASVRPFERGTAGPPPHVVPVVELFARATPYPTVVIPLRLHTIDWALVAAIPKVKVQIPLVLPREASVVMLHSCSPALPSPISPLPVSAPLPKFVIPMVQVSASKRPVSPGAPPSVTVAPSPATASAPNQESLLHDVNQLHFLECPPSGPTGHPIRFRLPASPEEWSDITTNLQRSLPSSLYRSCDDPRISATLITDVIRDTLPTLAPTAKFTRPLKKPQHIRNAVNLKRRLRSLRRQAKAQGTPCSVSNTDLTDAVHLHNHLSRVVQAASQFDGVSSTMKRYRANPAKFAKATLDKAHSVKPLPIKVTASEAEAFFRAAYSDSRNDPLLAPPVSIGTPSPPATPFNQSKISLAELRRLLKKKSNRGAPGPDGITYCVFKRSSHLQRALVQLFNDVLRTGITPQSWAVANIVLIPKPGGATDDVKDLRPIALTNTMGKLFTAIVARRLEVFLRANGSWDRTQKGFASATQGCMEHSFTLQQALQDARSRQNSIAVAWLDLKNAFGSISHKMVQFALRAYGVPLPFCQLIFALYNPLCARVSTPAWSTGYFSYQKGVFQGDPLSPVIFNLAFSPVVARIKQLNLHPYVTQCGVAVGVTAYADDLAVVTRTASQLQRILDDVAPLLAWMRLSFNPKKCIGLVLTRGAVQKVQPTLYIGKVPFANLAPEKSFKFLGVKIPATGDHKPILDGVVCLAREWWDSITSANVSIPAKLEIFRYSLSRLRWHLTVYDWPLSDVQALQAVANSFLRCWLHLPQSANLHVVHSANALNVPLITPIYKACQVNKHLHLQTNRDPDVVTLHAHRKIDGRSKWTVATSISTIDAFLSAEDFTAMMLGTANRGRSGLGYHDQSGLCRPQTRSQRASRYLAEEECALRLEEVLSLPSYSALWSAIERDMAQDRHWQRALSGLPDRLLTFALSAATNSLPSNSNLTLWRKIGSSNCPLCNKLQTTGHILNCCPVALAQGRYTFRHDLVLGVFIHSLSQANPELAFHFSLDYVTPTRDYTFPLPVSTALRPDVLVTSKDGATVWIAELTVPLPHRTTISNSLKGEKYKTLAAQLSALGRTVHLVPWEISSLGNVAHSTRRALLALGLSSAQCRRIGVSLSQAAIHGSYVVFQHRNLNVMPPQPLLELLPRMPLPSVHLPHAMPPLSCPIAHTIKFLPSAAGVLVADKSGDFFVDEELDEELAPEELCLPSAAAAAAHDATGPPSAVGACAFACPKCSRSFPSHQGAMLHAKRWCKVVSGSPISVPDASLL